MAPAKKRARQDEHNYSQPISDVGAGFLRWEITVANMSSKGISSPKIDVCGTPCHLSAFKYKNSFLQVYLHFDKCESDLWSVDVSTEFRLINTGGKKDEVKEIKDTFNNENHISGLHQFTKWENVIGESKGFAKNGVVTLETRITPSNVRGIRLTPRVDFTDPDEPRHDVALLIKGEKIYVSKQYLAIHSPVFNSMFYANWSEKAKNEIELKDVDFKEFIEMLNVIYPSFDKLTDVNAEPLLKLADRFQIKMVIDQAEEFFINSKKANIPYKLNLADKYRLVKLQEHCLAKLQTVTDIQNLKKMDGYKLLSKGVKATLLEKIMRMREETSSESEDSDDDSSESEDSDDDSSESEDSDDDA